MPTFASVPRPLPDLEVATPLLMELVFARDAIWLYARDPALEPTCGDVVYPDVGVCARFSDVPCDAHLQGPSLAPCLRVAELVVAGTGERIPFDPHGGRSAIEPWTFDPTTAALTLHLEGCSLSADVALPAPDAAPPAIARVTQSGDVTAVTLDRAVRLVEDEHSGFEGTACGAPRSAEVRLRPRPGMTTRAGAVVPLGVVPTAFGPLRVSQHFEPVAAIREVARAEHTPIEVPVESTGFTSIGALNRMRLRADGGVILDFATGDGESTLHTTVTLGRSAHVVERHMPDGRTLRAVRPPRVRGGGLSRFEAFSVYWRERMVFEDPSGATPPVEDLLWLELSTNVALLVAK